MASQRDRVKENCTITWRIENVMYCWQKKGEIIESPSFVVDTLENTKWRLGLFPRGKTNENYIRYFLKREDDGDGVETIAVDYDLAFLATNGSVLTSLQLQGTFKKNESWGWNEFAKREDVFTAKRSVYLKQDSLTARCRIWNRNEKAMETRQFFAKTIIQVERRSFTWSIEKFSLFQLDKKNTLFIKSASGVVLLTLDLYFKGELCFEKLINIHIESLDKNMKSLNFQTWLLDAYRSQVDCGRKEFLFDGEGDLLLLLTKEQLFGEKSLYLPNDVLTLKCECAFSTGVAFEGIEGIDLGNVRSRTISEASEDVNAHAEEKKSNTLSDDLKFLYRNQILCDTKLCAENETFPVHSILLSARSPVFRAMFTTDMKEKAKESVDIPDVDADILCQMLQYVYTDTLEIRDWESASLLYTVADKYEIISLRNLCSAYLKNNFCPTNACQILVLSDRHHDEDLKKDVQDYILKYDEVVFRLNEWKLFMDANLSLAAETMYRKWNKS